MRRRNLKEIENDDNLILTASRVSCTLADISSITKLTEAQIAKNFEYNYLLKEQVYENLEKNYQRMNGFSKLVRPYEAIIEDCYNIHDSVKRTNCLAKTSDELNISITQIYISLRNCPDISKQVSEYLKNNSELPSKRTQEQLKQDGFRIKKALQREEVTSIKKLRDFLGMTRGQLRSHYRQDPSLKEAIYKEIAENRKREKEKIIRENGVL